MRPIAILAAAVLMVAGCQTPASWQGTVKPKVTLKVKKSAFGSYILFESDKDDTYRIEELSFNTKTGEGTLKGLDFRQDSPAVIEANTAQMAALIPLRQQEIAFQAQVGQNIVQGINAITNGLAIGGEAGAKLISAGTKILEGAGFNLSSSLGTANLQLGGAAPKAAQPVAGPQPLELVK